ALLGGYDSFLERAFAAAAISRKTELGPFHSLKASGFYMPVFNYQSAQRNSQERWGLQLNAHSVFISPFWNWRISFDPELLYYQAKSTAGLSGFQYFAPGYS